MSSAAVGSSSHHPVEQSQEPVDDHPDMRFQMPPIKPRVLKAQALPYQEPVLIHTYKHLPSRRILHDAPPTAYLSSTRLNRGVDLNRGFHDRIERDPRLNEHIDGICESLLRYQQKGGEVKKGSVITWRGMLTR